MPLRIPDKLPAIELLKHENIFVMDESRAHKQEIRPLKICVLNLMPLKITTETDLVRLLSNTPLQLEVYFMKLKSHTPKNTPIEHMMMFYKDFQELSKQKFDGMIVTGAPIETMAYEEVEYWPEIKEIFDWARTHVTSTLYICWGAQAGLYHFYGVPKYPLEKKMFGIFKQKPLDLSQPIFRGFDDIFNMPHSRHTEVRREDIEKVPGLDIIAESPESGVRIFASLISGKLSYSSERYHVSWACASINDSIPECCIRSRQISRSRLRVMAFIAVSGFSMSQQPQRKSCFIAQSRAVLPPILSVSTEISASCRISVSICSSALFRTARMWRILVEQITSVCPLTSSGREIVISDIIVFPFGL